MEASEGVLLKNFEICQGLEVSKSLLTKLPVKNIWDLDKIPFSRARSRAMEEKLEIVREQPAVFEGRGVTVTLGGVVSEELDKEALVELFRRRRVEVNKHKIVYDEGKKEVSFTLAVWNSEAWRLVRDGAVVLEDSEAPHGVRAC